LSEALTILIVLPQTPELQRIYMEGLQAACPSTTFIMTSHASAALEHAGAADVLISFGVQLTDEVFIRAKRLRWVQALGSGVDGIVDSPSLQADVLVTNLHGVHGAPCAEAAFAAMLALARSLPRVVRNQSRASWERFPARLLNGKTVCLVGTGAIAEALAPRCAAFGMRVTGVSATPRPLPHFDEMVPRSALKQAVARADFVVVLAPYTEANRSLIDGPVLDAMKPSGFLINIARGGVVAEDALIERLRAGRIAGAALDVFATEPLPDTSPLWRMDNVLITPHLAGYHDEYPDYAIPVLVHNLHAYMAGDVNGMKNIVRRPAS
jgi:phosphoglycerate dehydrogenase-like enzyme